MDDSYSTPESTPLDVAAPGVLGNDSSSTGGVLSASLVDPPQFGVVSLAPDGSFSILPNSLYEGPDQFSYRATHPSGASDVATVYLDLTHVNHPPIAIDDHYETQESTPLVIPIP
ncbi:MAG: cadherin-like domain-containing protein, partial [Deltaproteobacteria bacterium]|nr:cadherin-like domain-containing protein [Deltaproteobacteria bacterium]